MNKKHHGTVSSFLFSNNDNWKLQGIKGGEKKNKTVEKAVHKH